VKNILAFLLLLTSCSVARHSEPVYPGFFACTGWIDKNHDGIRDFSEFQNIKDIFRTNENVMFVGFFEVPQGTMLKLQIIAPDRTVYKEMIYQQNSQNSVFYWKQSAREMMSNKLPGIWKAAWFVGDKPVTSTLITLDR
jgi:hypothetical protein